MKGVDEGGAVTAGLGDNGGQSAKSVAERTLRTSTNQVVRYRAAVVVLDTFNVGLS